MTFIQPKKESNPFVRLNTLLLIPIFLGLVSLVILYNQVVSANHEAGAAREKLELVEVENAELKEKLFGLFSGNGVNELAVRGGLVSDKNPEYFNPQKQWAFVSQ
ncbi:MAG: Uncharacterized protein G01um101420_939 [Parcubacteria group bacterium Gr01-1014_20]|nr:MAG: Uncharacterized protein G01um101420_939 [Parcubacteria group bacterium Gr01-1014_20]